MQLDQSIKRGALFYMPVELLRVTCKDVDSIDGIKGLTISFIICNFMLFIADDLFI